MLFAWQAQYLKDPANWLDGWSPRFRVAGAVLGDSVGALCVAGAVRREHRRTRWTGGRRGSAAALCVAGAILGNSVAALCVAGAVVGDSVGALLTGA